MAELSERELRLGSTAPHDAPPVSDDPGPIETVGPPRRRSATRETIETLVIALLLFFGMRQIMPSVLVDGHSMDPSLENHQHLLVNRILFAHFDWNGTQHYLYHGPQRGDVVVINPPVPTKEPYIKRLIGTPGDTILITDKKVFVNGVPLNEDYVKEAPNYVFPSDGKPLKLGEDQYFVLGDNRNASADSHIFGPITSDRIIGKAWVSFWPWRDLGFLPHRTYPIPS